MKGTSENNVTIIVVVRCRNPLSALVYCTRKLFGFVQVVFISFSFFHSDFVTLHVCISTSKSIVHRIYVYDLSIYLYNNTHLHRRRMQLCIYISLEEYIGLYIPVYIACSGTSCKLLFIHKHTIIVPLADSFFEPTTKILTTTTTMKTVVPNTSSVVETTVDSSTVTTLSAGVSTTEAVFNRTVSVEPTTDGKFHPF